VFMIQDSIKRANLRPFLEVVSWLAGYRFDDRDWEAITVGLSGANLTGPDSYFDYTLGAATVRLCEYGLPHVGIGIGGDADIERGVLTAFKVMQTYECTRNVVVHHALSNNDRAFMRRLFKSQRNIKKEYADRSVNARLAGSLLASEAWAQVVVLDSPDVFDFFEHLWEWPAVTTDNFESWEAWENDALGVALGQELPRSLQEAGRRAEVPQTDLRAVLENTAEAVYAHLFAAIDNDLSLSHLEQLGEVVAGYGVSLPPASLFPDEPYSLRHGWGVERSPEEVKAWRVTLREAMKSAAEV
jgi:hypothetical protein